MVIYRKYRPQKFSEVAGQENIIKVLKGAIKRDSVGHAYLFSGPRGTGKTTIARILSKAINCEKLEKDLEPCGKCGPCVEIREGKSLDFIEIDAASNRGIDEIRQLREGINFSPAKNKFRVFVLDEVHMLTKEAFNALLKTLEEPPRHAVFILATTEISKIPATIISRCQRFDFSRLSTEKIIERLASVSNKENIEAERAVLEIIARNSEGCARDAESLLGQIADIRSGKILLSDAQEILGLPDQEMIRSFAQNIIEKNAAEAAQMAEKILESGKNLFIAVSSLISYLRGILMIKIGPELEDIILKNYSDSELELMKKISSTAQISELIFAIKTLSDCYEKIKRSEFPHILLEIAVAELTLAVPPHGNAVPLLPNKEKSDILEEGARVQKCPLKDSGEMSLESDILQSIKKNWNDILIAVKSQNHSVFAFLKNCIPAGIIEDNICAAVNYQFYKERLNAVQSKLVIESVINDFLKSGKKLGFKCLLEEELKEMGIDIRDSKLNAHNSNISIGKQDDLIAEALKMFGGAIEPAVSE